MAAPPRFRSLEIGLTLADHRELRAQALLPKGFAGKRLPALLVFGGFESAGEVLSLLHPDVPVVLASFDYPYAGPREFRFPQTLLDGPRFKAMIRETTEGILALRRALARRPEIDPNRIAILGASFGTPFVVRAASLDPAFGRVILVHGFADPAGTIAHRLDQIWRPGLGSLAGPLAWASSRFLSYYLEIPKPEDDAPHFGSTQRVLMIEALNDSFIPKPSRTLLWNSLQRSPAASYRIQMPGDHLQPGSDRLIAAIMKRIEAWLGPWLHTPNSNSFH